MRKMSRPIDVSSYISEFPPTTRKLLREMRLLIRKTVPEAEEKISYGMPGYRYHGMLAYFAGYSGHIGFYPGTAAMVKFRANLKSYKTSKGTVQFPLDRPLPVALIRRIMAYRAEANERMADAKTKRKVKTPKPLTKK